MQLEADLSLLTFSGKKRRKHSIMTEIFLFLKYHVWNPASKLPGTVVCMLQLAWLCCVSMLSVFLEILTEKLNTNQATK